MLPDLTASLTTEDARDEPGHAPRIDMAARRSELYPALSAAEIKRMQRFGSPRRWRDGEQILTAGQTAFGLLLVLSGRIEIRRHDGMGDSAPIGEHGPGSFSADVAQLSGRPVLVNGFARGDVEVLAIEPAALRALLVAEAELGERIMRALILRRAAMIEQNAGGPVLIAAPGNAALLHLQHFLASNGHPYTLRDPHADAAAAALAARHAPGEADWPLVVCPDGSVKKNPSTVELGHCLGMLPALAPGQVFDLVVVGAGPAGLATAVYAASEGLSVLVLDQHAFGGQAGASSRIENYLGFPTGISGLALAGRAWVQAQKFGAEVAIPAKAARLLCARSPLGLALADGTEVRTRSLVLACGVRYRRPQLADLKTYEGRGVYYGASPIEGQLCRREEVILVGGGNSAGQAAVFLARYAAKVHIAIRGAGLAASMSRYLIERIAATPNIELHPRTEISGLEGDDDGLCKVRWRRGGDAEETLAIRRIFLFIGAEPNTAWLRECPIALDQHGFIRTGGDVGRAAAAATPASAATSPSTSMSASDSGDGAGTGAARAGLATSVAGVFAIGDVRSGSIKRVAAAVGEGAAVVSQIHQYLAGLPPPAAGPDA